VTSSSPPQSGSSPGTAGGGAVVASRDSSAGGSALLTERGRTSIADSVVTKIAGIATRQSDGVHDLGTGGTRAFGAIRQRIPGSTGPSITQGVSVEVGEHQAAIDLDVVIDYGVPIVDLAGGIRRNVIGAVERMTGLQVTEVNIAVDDIYIDSEEDSDQQQTPPRVQ